MCVARRRNVTRDSAPEIIMTDTAAASETNFSDLGLPAPRDEKPQKKAHVKARAPSLSAHSYDLEIIVAAWYILRAT